MVQFNMVRNSFVSCWASIVFVIHVLIVVSILESNYTHTSITNYSNTLTHIHIKLTFNNHLQFVFGFVRWVSHPVMWLCSNVYVCYGQHTAHTRTNEQTTHAYVGLHMWDATAHSHTNGKYLVVTWRRQFGRLLIADGSSTGRRRRIVGLTLLDATQSRSEPHAVGAANRAGSLVGRHERWRISTRIELLTEAVGFHAVAAVGTREWTVHVDGMFERR